MAGGIDTEAVYTHLDEFSIAFNQVFGYGGILGVQVYAVAGNLSPPAVGIVPVPACTHVVPVVVRILVCAVRIFQVGESGLILGVAV